MLDSEKFELRIY